jgi:Putative porin
MQVEIGADFKMNAAFTPNTYNPMVWQFQLQDTIKQAEYPWIDAFLSFKVQSFRFFFRFENMNTLWDKSSVFYQVAPYPQPFAALRFGIGWRFVDSNQLEPAVGNAQPPPGVGF